MVHVDDCEAVYRDGDLQLEGFVLSPQAVLAAVSIEADAVEADLEWFEQQGRSFPVSLGDVKWRRR